MKPAQSNNSAEHSHSEIQNAEFRIFVECITDYAIFTLDPGGRVLSWNAGAQRIKGYTASEIVGQHFSQFYLPEDIEEGKPERELAMAAAEERFVGEDWRLRKDGSRFLANLVLTAQRDNAGQLRGFVKVTHDITERKATEETLSEAHNTLQSIFDAAPVAVLSFDLQGRVKHWSAGAERMFGWTAAEALGRICPTVPQDGVADFLAMVARVADRGPESLVRVSQKKNGERINARLSPAPLRDHDGISVGIMVILEDVTEKFQADEVIRQSERELRLFTLATSDVFWKWDLLTGRIDRSIGFEKQFGYPLDSIEPVIGWWKERVHPDDRERVMAVFQRAVEERAEHCLYAYRFKRQDGSFATVEDRVYLLRDETGAAVQAIGAMTDITKRIEQQRAMLEALRQLSTAEDSERRRIAQELHDSTVQDLVAVILNLETLRETAIASDAATAKQIEDAVALLEKSAHDIRTLAYLLHPPQLDEHGLPGAIREYLTGFGVRTDIATRAELSMDGVRLDHAVELALFRVVQEALGNIYRHAQSPTATVRLLRRDGAVCLEIVDEGVGMAPYVLAPSKGRIGTLGVGLPAMRERLRQLGGDLQIESGAGGTLVRAVVPKGIVA